jgi:hypothetical protein
MNSYTKQIITEQATKIRREVEGGRLYGEAVDMTDADMVLVAAYFKAQHDEAQKAARDIDILMALHSR